MSLDRGRFGGDAPDHEIAVGPQTKIERVPDPSREQHHAGNLVVQRALAEEGPRICPFAAVDEADALLAERGWHGDTLEGADIDRQPVLRRRRIEQLDDAIVCRTLNGQVASDGSQVDAGGDGDRSRFRKTGVRPHD